MVEKLFSELKIVVPKEPLPTVELDMESLPDWSFDKIVVKALEPITSKSPSLVATIYVIRGESVSFHEPTDSSFFCVAGSAKILSTIFEALNKIKGIRVKYSDSVSPDDCAGHAQYHLEGGHLWYAVDAVWWASKHK